MQALSAGSGCWQLAAAALSLSLARARRVLLEVVPASFTYELVCHVAACIVYLGFYSMFAICSPVEHPGSRFWQVNTGAF